MEFDTGLDLLGIGAGIVMGLLAMKLMHWALKWGLYGLGGILIVVGSLGIWSDLRAGNAKSLPSIGVIAGDNNTVQQGGDQTMTDSPGGVQVQGDNNVINQGIQDRRIKKEDEFIQKMTAAGPVAVRVETVDGREPEFLQGQLYNLLIASKWAVETGGVFSGAVYWVNVLVAVRDKDNVPPAAIALIKQLRSNDVESFLVLEKNPSAFVLERNPVTEKADFIVRVGDRPPG